MGGALVFTSILGKSFIHLYRSYKLRTAIVNNFVLGKHYKGGFERFMSQQEAFLILGIKQTQNKELIQDAHRQLMRRNHPDNGGSHYLAQKINEAKDILMH